MAASERPNILWISSEDNGPHLGAYGDGYATTPNLDRLASRGLIYRNAWSNAPVCAPARTTIISGVYPPSTGSEHMRSLTRLPQRMLMFPQYLRQAGYYCTNNSKEDYNLEKPGEVWDESSKEAHWRKRQSDQPFFAVFNLGATHEGQIRRRPHTAVHDPEKVRVPAYHPDTPEVRQDWAQYYDKLTEMDASAGEILEELAADGLTGDTIVFYWGDHGPGMPRSKRWPYNSGLQVPLIVHIPEKFKDLASADYRAGGESDRLVGFIDLAPTVLSLAGIEPPSFMQGNAFLGEFEGPEQPYLFGFRGRMDERYDMLRVVRDKRYIYLRNYMPHRIYGQFISYMFQTPTTLVWKRLYDEGKLEPPKTFFWEPKPPEELYDLSADPDEVNNLSSSHDHRSILKRLRRAQEAWALEIRDVGFLPEGEIHARSQGSTPYEMGHDSRLFPLERILEVANAAASMDRNRNPFLLDALDDPDSGVRYWANLGFLMREQSGIETAGRKLRGALQDPAPYVRIAAAEALGRYGRARDLEAVLQVLIDLAPPDKNGLFVSMAALNALDRLDEKAAPLRDRIAALPTEDPNGNNRGGAYVSNLIQKILADLASSASGGNKGVNPAHGVDSPGE